jgi:DNA-binding transcriptional ArsR family regulator
MGTRQPPNGIASALLGKTRRAILALLFLAPDHAYYLRQIIRKVGSGRGATQRELRRLLEAGLVVRSRQGNMVLYQANRRSPIFAELRGLLVKTVGLADVLRSALARLEDRLQAAYVYGSVAAGREASNSDIDLLVIGDAGFGEVVDALQGAQENLNREINPSVFSAGEVRERLGRGDHFLSTVQAGPKIFIVGDEHELEELVR